MFFLLLGPFAPILDCHDARNFGLLVRTRRVWYPPTFFCTKFKSPSTWIVQPRVGQSFTYRILYFWSGSTKIHLVYWRPLLDIKSLIAKLHSFSIAIILVSALLNSFQQPLFLWLFLISSRIQATSHLYRGFHPQMLSFFISVLSGSGTLFLIPFSQRPTISVVFKPESTKWILLKRLPFALSFAVHVLIMEFTSFTFLSSCLKHWWNGRGSHHRIFYSKKSNSASSTMTT